MKSVDTNTVIAASATATVAIVIITGLVMLGSPREERMRRFDEQRVDHLSRLAGAMRTSWSRHHTLPDSLSGLPRDELASNVTLTDPETGEPYEYRTTGQSTFELCATFRLESDYQGPSSQARLGGQFSGTFWSHGAGRHCYAIDAAR